MPLFEIQNGKARPVARLSFKNEKELQKIIEVNLESSFGIKFLATEYTTSKQHGGRIDSLGIDDNNSPVIIEYKWHGKDNIINQGLFYLDWLVDHQGDFKVLVQKLLGKDIEVDFKTPRIILIAESFSKYDQFAINRMAENIELWKYSLYENNSMDLRLVASSSSVNSKSKTKITKVDYGVYTLEQHTSGKPKELINLFEEIREWILNLNEGEVQEVYRKHYIAYKTSRAFAYFHLQMSAIKIHIIVDKKDLNDPRDMGRDVSSIGHYGYGNTEVIWKNRADIDYVFDLIKQAFSKL